MTATYNPDHRGIGELLRSEMMQRAMLQRADEIKARAEAIAPVDEKGPHPGRYKASFHTKVRGRGGATNDRAEAVVWNDSPEAPFVEFAHWGSEPYRILARAAFERF